ncbi:signal recognition particle-docking protein FtsY [Candidatus Magnetaquicoccus inordinatus]|uniref:signal recognition particle-docking protein FtsY n=1 Tax=Candidatus Magnetaquicoccus inordinatus TaxID=2496818 RepID=UPI00102C66C7|nr:signal recognition particle-docking protein FtsY [Candidatus Magnetaquicoccus inordinatus]
MSFFARLREGLSKTRKAFTNQLDALLTGRKVDAELIEELEALLITSDFGLETASRILAEAQSRSRSARREEASQFREILKDVIWERFDASRQPWHLAEKKPHVILVVGVNGVGKTTTIGKLAAHFHGEGRKVILAAGDTFRAAAVAQLEKWGERVRCPVIAQGQNADSASVVHDAFSAAKARHMDLLLADTAGRLHTKVNLMEELKKIQRVLARQEAQAPHDVWLVLDATTGQNAIHQVKHFHEALGLTGLIITKLDGTAKGGVVVGISEQFRIPIRFIGVGEGVGDLKPFEPDQFVDALFARSDAG